MALAATLHGVEVDDRLRPGAIVRVIDTDVGLDEVAQVESVRYNTAKSATVEIRAWAAGPEVSYA
ncbi:MAG: hypothetical protein GY873_39280 [Bosea sp.]|uniref:hypothetical protein n=1 Tax=Bosea sp. (in: a-proteobacteria) TaxID=1871050 RepID=UPI002386DA11|nr:hypothetical protein [Bosea sp. (in: a-proteobacteria)]